MVKNIEHDTISQIHELKRTLTEQVFYPPHSERANTSQYNKIHHEMVVIQDQPCMICGVKNSTLDDKLKNKHNAKAMETHHHVVEWALANAIDLDKFNEVIVQRLRTQNSNNLTYAKDFTQQEMLAWIDHSPDNLWVLCDVHHRHTYVGIHAISSPIWSAQALIKDGYVLTPEE